MGLLRSFEFAFMVPLFFFFLFLHLMLLSSTCDGRAALCRAREREALLKFRDGVLWDGDSKLPWGVGEGGGGGDDCCSWIGIGCDNRTGHVVSMDFHVGRVPGYNYVNGDYPNLSGKISPSLAALKYLQRLDLSGNYFEESSIPRSFGSFERLTYLDLSNAGFAGVVPQDLGNLSNIQVLSLSDIYRIEGGGEWFSRLHKLQALNLSFSNLTGANNLLKELAKLPFLEAINLYIDEASDTNLLNLAHANFTRLVKLVIEAYYFMNPCWLFNITSLEYLDIKSQNMNENMCGNDFTAKSCNLKSLSLQSFTPIIWDLSPFFVECDHRLNLISLDLSYNLFTGQLPKWLGDYKSLQTLKLGNNNLWGSIPETIGGMTSLEVLDLSSNNLTGSIPRSIGGLRSLEYLDLSGNFISGYIPQSIGGLQSLVILYLQKNNLMGYIPQSIGSLHSLKYLYLYENNLMGSIPRSIGRLQSLIGLYLYENNLMGSIPRSIGNMQSLEGLDFQGNNLSGPVPSTLGELKSLIDLDLSRNCLQGNMSEEHFVHLSNLTTLDLSSNSLLRVTLSPHRVPPFSLKSLNLGSCKVGPAFPLWLRTQNTLQHLTMSNSGISDVLPQWIWDFSSYFLEYLDLSTNNLTGVVPAASNSSSLKHIILHSNRLQGSLSSFPLVSQTLLLSSNLLSGAIDHIYMLSIETMFLSRNNFSGSIPSSICEAEWLLYLDLSHNRLSGELPSCPATHTCRIRSLHLNDNNLNGTLPAWLWNCTKMDLLDMGENIFSGVIPNRISNIILNLKVLRLRSNSFYGSIPMELSNLTSLHVLDLADNYFSGRIPPTFGNFSAMKTPFVGNETLGFYAGAYYQESIMVASKGLDQSEPESTLKLFTSIDLSGNKLSGDIPAEVGRLVYLRSLNLSHNCLRGCIPETFAKLSQLESLDLSSNNLSGAISQTLSGLTFMSTFNVSFNNLSGRIPSGGQFDTYPNSSYIGNLNLCGKPLQTVCPSDLSPPIEGYTAQTDQKDRHYFLWLSLSVVPGFIMGFWTCMGILFFKSDWRYAYFQFVDCLSEKCYLLAKVYVDKCRRMCRRS